MIISYIVYDGHRFLIFIQDMEQNVFENDNFYLLNFFTVFRVVRV